MKPVSRASGRSAVASAAYRSATQLENMRDGRLHDYSRKAGVEHSEIVLPEGMKADWALDRSALWNAAELAEKPDNARVAREFEVALPHELSLDAQIDLCRSFSQDLANRHGAAVDFAVHAPHVEGDIRNTHAHILMTTRAVTPEGLGAKTCIEWKNARLLGAGLPTTDMQLRDIRQAWEVHTNRHLEAAGLDIRIDHRSHVERGLEIAPTEHMGVHATQMARRGRDVSRVRIDVEVARRNAVLVREKPEQVLTIITGEKSVFDRYDVARTLHRYIHDDTQAFQSAFAAVMASPTLVEMQSSRVDPATGEVGPVRYSTKEMVGIESGMVASAGRMHQARGYGVDQRYVARAVARQDAAIARSRGGASDPGEPDKGLSDEQRRAIEHITGPERISAVIGFAGAGKSTMLAAAREAWEAQGYRVHGAALSGKAAEGLEDSSGIQSRTLASWDYGWQAGRDALGSGDVLVIDEAGMVSSRQLARFVHEVEDRGAKIVLVGDHGQLQAIGAGAPFRAIAERTGAAELSEIRRQRVDWQREASIAFATHRTAGGLAAYDAHGAIHVAQSREAVCAGLVRDYLADREERAEGSRIALAHRRVDVRALNDAIRSALQERGALAKGEEGHGPLGREVSFQTNDGRRSFAPGDRIVFLENNRDLVVKNGMLGTVEKVGPDALCVRPDRETLEPGVRVAPTLVVNMAEYQAIDHGYATTVHKSQGATVDRAFVMASGTMDRHLTYVAMTRHRDSVQLYVDAQEFKDMAALSARLGRSGAKEVTLDYTQPEPAREGREPLADVRHDHDQMRQIAGMRAQDLPASRDHNSDMQGERVAPLIPVMTEYARSVDEVAREKAMPDMRHSLEDLHYPLGKIYADPAPVAEYIRGAVIDRGEDASVLARAMADNLGHYGELRGKTGLFGANRERREAMGQRDHLRSRVEYIGKQWTRRHGEELDREQFIRANRDTVEVPGLGKASEAILCQLDAISFERGRKESFIDAMLDTPEGRKALDEAHAITAAIYSRFAAVDPMYIKKDLERLCTLSPEITGKLDRINAVANLAQHSRNAEISRDHARNRELARGQSRGISIEM